jgi:hypothetical protein
LGYETYYIFTSFFLNTDDDGDDDDDDDDDIMKNNKLVINFFFLFSQFNFKMHQQYNIIKLIYLKLLYEAI